MGARIPLTASSTPFEARKYERPAMMSTIVLMGFLPILSTRPRIPRRSDFTQPTAVSAIARSIPRALPRGTITLAQPLPPLSWRPSTRRVTFSPLKRKSRTFAKGATTSRMMSMKSSALASAVASAKPQAYSLLTVTSDHVVASPKYSARLAPVLNASRPMFTPRIWLRRSLTVLNVLASIPAKMPAIAPTIVFIRLSVNAYSPRK